MQARARRANWLDKFVLMNSVLLLLRPLIATCTLVFASQIAFSGQTEWTTESLMEKLAEVKEAELTFVELRTSSFLLNKLKLTGRMNYRAPDFIQKIIESPFHEKIEIDGDKLSIEKTPTRGEPILKQYSIASSEVLSTAVEGIQATLAGNLSVLTESYEVEMTGDVSDWSVRLIPKSPEALQQIEKIEISGSDRLIKLIETFNADGDETSLVLSYVKIR
jgi:hypothetical protein